MHRAGHRLPVESPEDVLGSLQHFKPSKIVLAQNVGYRWTNAALAAALSHLQPHAWARASSVTMDGGYFLKFAITCPATVRRPCENVRTVFLMFQIELAQLVKTTNTGSG